MAGMRQAHALLADGAIGDIRHVMHQRVFFVEKMSTDWRRVENECGGLYLSIFGSHDVDAALWLMSATTDTAAVPARVWSSLRANSEASGGDSDGVLCLDFDDGRLTTFQFSVCSRQNHQQMLLIGAQGTLSLLGNEVRLDGELVEAQMPANVYADSFAEQLRQFVAGLQGEGALPAPGREVLTVVRTLDLARESAELGLPRDF
jgi:predicted dehydrogenase